MRLSQILGPQITSGSRSRGQSYFLSGAVRSLTVENGVIQATVRGTESYTVWIESEGARLIASCTCPYFIDHIEICKHIWAVVLSAEAQGIALVKPGVAPARVEIEPLYPDDSDEYLDDEPDDDADDIDAIVADDPRRLLPRFERRPPPAPAPPPWRQLLTAVTTSASAPAAARARLAEGQLLHVVDVPTSVQSGSLVVEIMTRDRKANGEWGKAKPARLTDDDIRTHPDENERHILERLAGARQYVGYGGYSAFGHDRRLG